MPRRPEPSASLGGPLGGLDRREVAGALADLGVLVPIVVALILVNGLSASAVLLPAGLLYLAAGAFYRVPIPVQPLKAFGAIAIAQGLGADVIAAGSLLMAAVFIPLGVSGLLDRAAAVFPKPLVRGVQLSVGILLVRLAWGLVVEWQGEPIVTYEVTADQSLDIDLADETRRGPTGPIEVRRSCGCMCRRPRTSPRPPWCSCCRNCR